MFHKSLNLVTHFRTRENGVISNTTSFEEDLYIGESFLNKLNLETELTGHTGCVNCLNWSRDGEVLCSGSDDTKIIIWDAFRHKNLKTIETPHQGNIFSVIFLSNGDSNNIVASGAADGNIFVHDIEKNEIVASFSMEARVKRIANSQLFPDLIFSASEDGMIREFDLRQPTRSGDIFINLTSDCGKSVECKCVTINPLNPNLMAVGCNDPYLRLYDLRKIKNNGHKLLENCVMYFNPAHIHDRQRSEHTYRHYCVTYAAFDPKGRELLVNLGGEQIYLYDIYNFKEPLNFNTRPNYYGNTDKSSSTDNTQTLKLNGKYKEKISYYKTTGNDLFAKKEYCSAIKLYNKANCLRPTSIIYGNRAAAYIRRAWEGDFYAALRDCNAALQADPGYVKAHFRFARCLYELGWLEEAEKCLNEFKEHHPEHSSSSACLALKKEIQEKITKKQSTERNKIDPNLSLHEAKLRLKPSDYTQRYCGHCNTTTDIKEANFFGPSGQYIIAGSDEGSFFIWEKETSNLVRVMKADSSIVNCVQPHPKTCLLATSGIDSCIRLWSPRGEVDESRVVNETNVVSDANQKRMRCDPLESMLISMGMPFILQDGSNNRDDNTNSENCQSS